MKLPILKKKFTYKEEMERLYKQLQDTKPTDEDYSTVLEELEKLNEMELAAKRKNPIDPNHILAIVGNLAGIVLILKHEELNVITSKALGFVSKAKI